MTGQPAAGGGRWVEVSPERIEAWLRAFADRHGRLEYERGEAVRLRAPDSSLAECHLAFPPLADTPHGWSGEEVIAAVARHALRRRTVGVLLVRLGGYAAGVFDGTDLVVSKVGSRLVHGRHSAGGRSQQRFHRRREGEIRQATRAAADVASRVLIPEVGHLHAVVLGGDRRAVDALRSDRRLAPLFALAVDRFLSVPDPKLAVLRQAPQRFRAVRIRLVER